MNMTTILNRSTVLAARRKALGLHVGACLLGLLLLFPIILEYYVALDSAERLFRGYSGELTDVEASRLPMMASAFCVAMLFIFHFGLKPFFGQRISQRVALSVLILGCIIALSGPIAALFQDLRIGNSISTQVDGSFGLKNWLVVVSNSVRALVIVAAAICVYSGCVMIYNAIKGIHAALSAGGDAQILIQKVSVIDGAQRSVESLKRDAIALNHTEAGEIARGLVTGRLNNARETEAYLKGPDPFMSPEAFKQELLAQFSLPETAIDPVIALAVEDRLREEMIDIAALPDDPRNLTPEARQRLAGAAAWLRHHANFNSIYSAIAYEDKSHA